MNKSLIAGLIVVLLIFGSYIVYYNIQTSKEDEAHRLSVAAAKERQSQLDDEFYKQKEEKSNELEQQIISTSNQDADGDGLTYAQELNLGTDDSNPDSDGDGILDAEDFHPAGGGQNNIFTVNWQYKGNIYTTQFGIPEDWYHYYRDKDRSTFNYEDSRFATPNDLTIKTIAEDITDAVRLKGGDYVEAAIDFVESMTYQYDIDYNSNPEYPKYAIETIVDERGDCEDTSFLMASILEALNIDTVILLYSDHAAVGVWCDTCSGTYYLYNGRKYFFLETTGYSGYWEIGRIWGKYGDESPRIIEV